MPFCADVDRFSRRGACPLVLCICVELLRFSDEPITVYNCALSIEFVTEPSELNVYIVYTGLQDLAQQNHYLLLRHAPYIADRRSVLELHYPNMRYWERYRVHSTMQTVVPEHTMTYTKVGWKQRTSLTAEDWNAHLPFFKELYLSEQLTLPEVMRVMDEKLGFVAT